MIDTAGDLAYSVGPTGATFEDTRPKAKLFKITGGANPYSATERILDPDTGAVSDANGMVVADTMNLLWELRGVTTVAVDTEVWAFPNPLGNQAGWIFEAPGGGGSGSITTTSTEATTAMTLDTPEAAPDTRYWDADFSVKKGATTADPKTVRLKFAGAVTFLEKLCPTYKWLTVADGVLIASDTDNGGVKVLADLQPQRKTFTPPNGATITDVACSGLDTTCCVSTWWCTGPGGSPAWTVVEVAYGDTPPAGGYGPYATEAEATANCIPPEGDPIPFTSCGCDITLPRTLTLTVVGYGSYPMVWEPTFGAYGAWITTPTPPFANYPGLITICDGDGKTRVAMYSDQCGMAMAFDGNFCFPSGVTTDPEITCSPFSVTQTFEFYATGGSPPGVCPCENTPITFIITE